MDDLDVLIPQPRTVEGIEVRPLVVRQLSPFARALQRMPADLLDRLATGDLDILAIAAHADLMAEAVAIATDRTVEEVGEMQIDQLANLAAAVVEVNVDFFVRRLEPMLTRIAQHASRSASTTGQSSSSGSSAAGTA